MYVFLQKGGPLMWPLLFCSVVALVIVIERILFWWHIRRRRDDRAVEEICLRTEKGDFEGALSAGRDRRDSAAEVIVAGLRQRDHGLREAMETSALDAIDQMRRGLNILDTIITMAPLLGILGTVLGIIESFDILGQSGIQDPKAVTGGIAQALITTAAGLSVALATLVPFNWLTARVERATRRLENLTTHFEVAYRKGTERENATEPPS